MSKHITTPVPGATTAQKEKNLTGKILNVSLIKVFAM